MYMDFFYKNCLRKTMCDDDFVKFARSVKFKQTTFQFVFRYTPTSAPFHVKC
jgi:hypothetical protein